MDADPKRKLKGMLARIFSDASATADERAELEAFLASGALGHEAVASVVADFVATTWKMTTADGVVTDHEKQRLREIARVLKLEAGTLPAEWASLL
jgi:tellurite resistance protein